MEEQPSLNYKMDLNGNTVRGFCDKLEAMKQTIFRILQTERYQYLIYSQNHGIETLDLYGEPITWVCPELERRIKDALSVDTRINYATDFQHDISIKGQVHTSFRVNTIYGDVVAERTVNI